jgi:eukaryotic-like serine/threonine-protein kinase
MHPFSRASESGRHHSPAPRCWQVFILSCLAIVLTGCAATPEATGTTADRGQPLPTPSRVADGGVYLANIQRTGEYPSVGPAQVHGLIWKYTTPQHSTTLQSSVVSAAGAVYFVTSDGYLHKLDPASGNQEWQDRAHRATPAIAGGIIYYGWQSVLYAADTKTQQHLWQFQTGAEIESSPVILDGVVYFGSDDGYLYALDEATGHLEWKFKGGDRVTSDPAVSGGVVYFAGSTWLHTPSTDYAEPQDQIYAVDSATGRQIWTFQREASVYSPAIAEGVVYCVSLNKSGMIEPTTGLPTGSVYALDGKSGRPVGKYTPSDGLPHPNHPILADGVLYIGGRANTLHAIDLRTGQDRWTFKSARYITLPSVAGRLIYFGSADGYLYAIDTRTGQERWSFHMDTALVQPPVVADGTLYGVTQNSVYAIR